MIGTTLGTTPKMVVMTAVAKSLEETFGKGVHVSAKRSGSRFQLNISGLPDFLTGRFGSVVFSMPAESLTVTKDAIRMRPLNAREVTYTSGGKAYNHPHIWPDGYPCPGDNGPYKNLARMAFEVYETVSFRSVTKMSLSEGHVTPSDAGRATIEHGGFERLAAYKTRISKLIEPRDDPMMYLEERLRINLDKAMRSFA